LTSETLAYNMALEDAAEVMDARRIQLCRRVFHLIATQQPVQFGAVDR
jgi:hypothetical protein